MQPFHLSSARRGLTLVETAASAVVLTLIAAIAIPMTSQVRSDGPTVASAMNLAQIGTLSSIYAIDSQDRLPNYSWKSGTVYLITTNDGDTLARPADDDMRAQQYQATDLLRRLTGRIEGQDKIWTNTRTMPHRRFWHLVLIDHFGLDLMDPIFAMPADANLIAMRAYPMEWDAMAPEAGQGYGTFCEQNYSQFLHRFVRVRWPYSSSYQPSVSTWCPMDDDNNVLRPISNSMNLFTLSGNPELGGQRYAEVAHPSAKVHLYEEFDRRGGQAVYMGFPESTPNKLMFDGSVQDLPTGAANAGWDPSFKSGPIDPFRIDPFDVRAAITAYTPLSTFPQDRCDEPINERYRWTYRGLRGIDYPILAVPGDFEGKPAQPKP